MATQVQFRRGTSAQNSAFTGAAGELSVDTDKDSLIVHDGSTQGGFEVAKDDLSNVSTVGILTVGIVTGTTSIGVTNVYATTLYGNGSNLTGITAGATLSAGSGSQRVVVTSLTTGTMTSAATDAELTYNSGTNALTATSFVGNLTGDVTGNADTATTLATARNIGGVSFDGSAAINLPGVNATGNQDTSGTASIATNVTVADESSDTTCFPLFATAATGNLPPKSGTNLTFNSSSGQLTATSFSGDGSALTGIDATSIKDSNGTVRAQANTSGVVVTGIATATTFVGALTGNVTGNVTGNSAGTHTGAVDLNGGVLTLDVDADTTITADTDDQIDIAFGGNDRITLSPGLIDLKNDGSQSALRLYCETSNAHYAALQAPAHGSFSGNVTVTLPATTDTLIGRTTTDTLTNKTLTSPTITGTGNIAGSFTGDVTGNADTATTSTNVTVADESSDTTCFPLFATAATGNLPPKSGTNLTFNSSTGALTATSFVGALTGNVTGNTSGTAGGLSGAPSITVADITATGNVSIAGTLTYEDVTSVDAVGIVTARTGVRVTSGGIVESAGGITGTHANISGIVTANSFRGDGSNLTGITAAGTGAIGGLTIKNQSGTVVGTAGSVATLDFNGSSGVSVTATSGASGVATINISAELVSDTSPQLGGDLDLNSNDITGTGNLNITGNVVLSGTVDGRDVATDGTKLDGIEASATGDQTAAEIRTLVESASDSNVFTDDDHSKLNGIESSATADQTDAEIRAAVEAATDSNVFTDADHTKLNGIAASATNVTNTNQLTNGAGFITATLTDEQVQDIVGGMVTGNTESGITVTYQDGDGTIDFSVASQTDNNFTTTLKNKLDGIAASATNVTNNNQLTNGAGYVTANTQLSNEQVQDIVGGMVSSNSESGITVTYQDGDGTLDFSVTSQTDNNFTTTLKNKLDGIASGATNVTNTNQLTNGAGYITSANGGNAATLDSIDSSQFLRSDTSDQKTSGTLRFNDNVILSLGSSDDAEFFVNGSHLYLDLNSGIGNFYIRDGTTTRFTFDDAGDFTATGNITANSDITLKENIETIPNALDKVLNLRGVEYDRIDMEGNPHHIGVIAQEIEEVIPEVVSTNEEGIKSVAYGNIIGVLIEAVKEQQNQINDLKDEIKSMKG